ncbi:hypothetical protein BDF20DRAFT_365791 [Mycotypha africana]|uniref:uncharacterized protein n=1 Tax=Mycotypha africana TaxID=64632 RepID=UPI0023007137|nr:uncharacterized protein BDF20DRAFT_365791 [Mycotypha africana]KAI8984104.1 hypothetical protein BDF20DRAFT_365791 [Mycotypha africana]
MIEEYCRDLNELYSKIALDDIAADWNSYYHTLRKITEEQISSLKILIDKLYEEDVGSVTQHIDCSLIKGQFQKTVFNQLAEAKAQFADKFKMTAISEVEANKFSSNADLINDDPGFTRTQEAVEPITIYNSVQEAQNVFKSRATNTIVIFQEKIAIWYDTLFNNIQKVQLVATDCIELKKKVEAIVSQALEEISIIMEDTKLTFKQQSVVSENNSTEIVNSTQKAQKQVITLLENVHEVINEQITTLVKFAINEDLNSTEENFVILQEQAKHKTQAALENIVSAGVSVGFEGKTIELVKTAIIPESFKNVKYIAFDIMGTIVNYHATIANEWSRLLFQKKTKESVYCILNQIDIHAFAIRWYGLYLEKRLQVSWSQSDISLLLATLKSLLAEYLIPPTAFSEAELQTLASAWFKLQLFADASASIKKLKQLRNMYVISISYAFSIRSMMDLARYNCFCWHAQFTADIFAACTVNNGTLPQETLISNMPMLLGIENTDEIAIVSADPVILNAAKAHGFNTVYIDHHAISNDASNIHAETVNNEQIFADIEFDGLDVFAESFETFHAVKAAPVPVSSFDSNISGSRSWFQRMVSKVTDTAEVLKHTIID